MRLIMLGAPGSGKGTQSLLISERFNLPCISTGELLKESIKRDSKHGELIISCVKNGILVPDEIISDLLVKRLKLDDCKNGFILDGYPRTVCQAENLLQMLSIDIVIFLDVMQHIIERRLLSKRVCPNCKKIFSNLNYFNQKCDACNTLIVQRDEDKIDAIRNRIDNYNLKTAPLITYFKQRKKLFRVGGDIFPDETYKIIEKELRKMEGR